MVFNTYYITHYAIFYIALRVNISYRISLYPYKDVCSRRTIIVLSSKRIVLSLSVETRNYCSSVRVCACVCVRTTVITYESVYYIRNKMQNDRFHRFVTVTNIAFVKMAIYMERRVVVNIT